MKKYIKIFVPVLLAVVVVCSLFWYLFIYDRDFTQNLLLNQARAADSRGDYSTAAWFYDLAYRHSNEDENVAIELADQFKSIGNYTKAEYTLSNAISDGGGTQLYVALCKTYVEQDKLRDAVAMLDNIADPAVKAELDAIRPLPPVCTPEESNHSQYISFSLSGDNGNIYFTTNGEYPSIKGQLYQAPVALNGGVTKVHALTVGDNGLVSPLKLQEYTVAGVIEAVTISDPILDQLVRQKLNVSDTHTLYSNQLWNITSLEISTEALYPSEIDGQDTSEQENTKPDDLIEMDLSELALMPFIEDLNIQQGKYENLGVISGLNSLKSLTISGVTLTAEEIKTVASLPDLTVLSLERCNITSIDSLAAATKLTHLNLSYNTISNLQPISALSNLEYLNLSHNYAVTQLTSLTGSVKLKELDVSHNSVNSTVALSGCKSLEALNLEHNAITSFEGLEKLSGLKYLYAAHNQISDISHLANAVELTELDISENALSDISVLSNTAKLSVLNFANNQVTALPAFAKDSPLATINGTRNLITSLDSLNGLKQLNYVIMDYNEGILSVSGLSNCNALVEVSVYGTGVTDVSALTKQNVIVKYAPI